MGKFKRICEVSDLMTEPKSDAGWEMARRSFMERRLTKKQRVYSTWLGLADCWPDWKFEDFVRSKDPHIVSLRRNA